MVRSATNATPLWVGICRSDDTASRLCGTRRSGVWASVTNCSSAVCSSAVGTGPPVLAVSGSGRLGCRSGVAGLVGGMSVSSQWRWPLSSAVGWGGGSGGAAGPATRMPGNAAAGPGCGRHGRDEVVRQRGWWVAGGAVRVGDQRGAVQCGQLVARRAQLAHGVVAGLLGLGEQVAHLGELVGVLVEVPRPGPGDLVPQPGGGGGEQPLSGVGGGVLAGGGDPVLHRRGVFGGQAQQGGPVDA